MANFTHSHGGERGSLLRQSNRRWHGGAGGFLLLNSSPSSDGWPSANGGSAGTHTESSAPQRRSGAPGGVVMRPACRSRRSETFRSGIGDAERGGAPGGVLRPGLLPKPPIGGAPIWHWRRGPRSVWDTRTGAPPQARRPFSRRIDRSTDLRGEVGEQQDLDDAHLSRER